MGKIKKKERKKSGEIYIWMYGETEKLPNWRGSGKTFQTCDFKKKRFANFATLTTNNKKGILLSGIFRYPYYIILISYIMLASYSVLVVSFVLNRSSLYRIPSIVTRHIKNYRLYFPSNDTFHHHE